MAAAERPGAFARDTRTLVEAIDLSLSPPLINATASCAPHSTCDASVSPASDEDDARLCPLPILQKIHFIRGNAMTSLMLGLSVRSMTRRSMPIPMPPVGGIPVSIAIRKSSSTLIS